MADKRFEIVLIACILLLIFGLFMAQRSQSQLMHTVLDNLRADCAAGSQASYCQPTGALQ